MRQLKLTKRHGAFYVVMGIVCIAMMALVGFAVAAPLGTSPVANAPNDVAYTTTANDSSGTDAAMVTTQATQANSQDATIGATTGATAGGYDVICPITATQSGKTDDTLTANMTSTIIATDAGTTTGGANSHGMTGPIETATASVIGTTNSTS